MTKIDPAAVAATNYLGYVVPGINDELGVAKADVKKKEAAYDNTLQSMFDKRRESLQQQKNNNVKVARFNAFGNMLRALVTPFAWAGGKATTNIQPFDNRQYIESFNRAVRLSDDISNLGAEEDAYRLKTAEDRYREARRKAELLEAEQRRRDAQQEAASDKTPDYEGRKTSAINSWYLHGRPNKVSLDEWLDLGGRGESYFGGWKPDELEIEQIGTGKTSQPVADKTVEGNKDNPAVTTTTGQEGRTNASKGLTKEEQAIIDKWEKYDKDKNGQLSEKEMKRGLFSLRKPKAEDDTASRYAAAIAKRNKLQGKASQPVADKTAVENKDTKANNKENKEKPANARSIMGV